MPSSDPAPARVAFRTLPYAVPFAAGLACLAWGLTELVAVLTDAFWVATELLVPLLVSILGTALLFFGGVAALSVVADAAAS